MPRVSIVMPVYNAMPYLREAIESILRQTFTDFEFLIVDDASTDGGVACVWSFQDARIRLVRNDANIGQTASLNRGLALAVGEFVARMDADDICVPERLARQVVFLEQHPDVAVLGAYMGGLDDAGRTAERWGRTVCDFSAFAGALLLGACPLCHPVVMFRREAVAAVGGYDETFRIGQDYDLWVRLALCRRSARVLPETLAMYRAHARQQSVAARDTHQEELRTIHERLVRRWAPAARAERIAWLLRRDDRFWDDCRRAEDIAAAGRALRETLTRMAADLSLTTAEAAAVRRMVYRRVLSPLSLPGVYRLLARVSRWWRVLRRAMRRVDAVPVARVQ